MPKDILFEHALAAYNYHRFRNVPPFRVGKAGASVPGGGGGSGGGGGGGDPGPPPPPCGDTVMTDIIVDDMWGLPITYHFDQPYPCGQWWYGGWYVLGTPILTRAEPDFDGHHHGIMVNIVAGNGRSGMVDPQTSTITAAGPVPPLNTFTEHKTSFFDPSMVLSLPYQTNIGDFIVKGRSLILDEVYPNGLARGQTILGDGVPRWYLRPAQACYSVLSILDPNDPPPCGAFRPPFVAGATRKHKASGTQYWTFDDIDVSWLPNLPAPPGINSYESALSKARRMKVIFQGTSASAAGASSFWIGSKIGAALSDLDYGREAAAAYADVLLTLCTDAIDASQKKILAGWLVQQALDLYGPAEADDLGTGEYHIGQSAGGIGIGYNIIVPFAGYCLNFAPFKEHAHGVRGSQVVQEKNQIINIPDAATLNKYSGVSPKIGKINTPHWAENPFQSTRIPGTYGYMTCCTSNATKGIILAYLLMGIMDIFGENEDNVRNFYYWYNVTVQPPTFEAWKANWTSTIAAMYDAFFQSHYPVYVW